MTQTDVSIERKSEVKTVEHIEWIVTPKKTGTVLKIEEDGVLVEETSITKPLKIIFRYGVKEEDQ